MKKDTLQMTLLLDFYGALLTEKQNEYFEMYYGEDLSLTEIAEKAGISKQGVHDLLKRVTAALTDIEEKTGLMQKWISARESALKAAREGIEFPPDLIDYFKLGQDDIGI